MKVRMIAAFSLLPLLLIVLLVLPEIFTAILIGLMAAIGAYELLFGTGLVKEPWLIICTALMAMLVSLWSYFGMDYSWAMVGILVFSVLVFAQLLITHAKLEFSKIGISFLGGVLIPFLLTALVRIRAKEDGIFLVLISFAIAFISDSGAYFAGRFFGKHKLAPVISPKKTIEGVVGGIVATILGLVVFFLVLQLGFDFRIHYMYVAVYGLLGSLAAVFGDLIFSAVKRQVGIKDYGNLIPGHGGILDRFDSMVIVAPLTEVLLILFPIAVR